MPNENSKLNDLAKLLSDKDVVGDLSKNPNNASEILKKANLTNEEAKDVGNLVTTLKELSPEELKLASGGNVKESLLKGYKASTAFMKKHWKPIFIVTAAVAIAYRLGRHVAKKRIGTDNFDKCLDGTIRLITKVPEAEVADTDSPYDEMWEFDINDCEEDEYRY